MDKKGLVGSICALGVGLWIGSTKKTIKIVFTISLIIMLAKCSGIKESIERSATEFKTNKEVVLLNEKLVDQDKTLKDKREYLNELQDKVLKLTKENTDIKIENGDLKIENKELKNKNAELNLLIKL